MTNPDAVLPAVASGVFALLGAFVGASITSKTIRKGWLFQRRAEVFEKFLAALEKSREETAHYLRSSPEEEPAVIEQKTIDLYESAFAYARIARLYVKKGSKEKVEQLVRDIRALQASPRLGDQRHHAIIRKAEELQILVESHLETPDW